MPEEGLELGLNLGPLRAPGHGNVSQRSGVEAESVSGGRGADENKSRL